MDMQQVDDSVARRIRAIVGRAEDLRSRNLYFYNQPISELRGGARALVNGREMGMYASYSYLGLIGHPRINAAASSLIGPTSSGIRSAASSSGPRAASTSPLSRSALP